MNKIFLAGNLGADVVEKSTQNGKTFWRFSVATSERWTDQQGQKQSRTTWHNCTLWGNYQNLAPYLLKGQSVIVEGIQRHDSVQDNQGQTKYFSYVMVNSIELTGSANSGGNQNQQQRPQAPPQQQQYQQQQQQQAPQQQPRPQAPPPPQQQNNYDNVYTPNSGENNGLPF